MARAVFRPEAELTLFRHVARCKTVRSEGLYQQRSGHVNSYPSSGQCAQPGSCT